MLHQMAIEWKYVKTYASEKALMRRIEEDKNLYPEYDDQFIIMRTPDGRWTAVVKLDLSKGGYIGRYEFLKM